jgi:dTDP-4-amino-4,6-dideoxygalactose transaminase
MTQFLPFALPSIDEEEINEVIDTLKSKWITSGPKTKIFEQQFAKYLGVKHAIAVNSGTAALHLALESIGVGKGDQIITSPFTFTATAETIRYLGAEPIFIDIEEDTFNIDVSRIEQFLENANLDTSRIKSILPVHYGGQACEMDKIMDLALRYNCSVIEDAAHALPTTSNGKMIGTIGDITCFSFYATKPLTTGEGGMAVTQNDALADRMITMRLHGINKDIFDRYTSTKADWFYEVVAPGFKYNMSDIAAALGIQQLKKVDNFQKRRRYIAKCYNEAFINLPEIESPCVKFSMNLHSWHLYVIKLNLDLLQIDRSQFILEMKNRGVGTSVHFIPLHIQPYYRERYNFKPSDFPNSYRVYQKIVSLPIYPKMTDDDIEKVISAVKNIVAKHRKK